jgi:hypothetical protein
MKAAKIVIGALLLAAVVTFATFCFSYRFAGEFDLMF